MGFFGILFKKIFLTPTFENLSKKKFVEELKKIVL
jgi:hypothetical protein